MTKLGSMFKRFGSETPPYHKKVRNIAGSVALVAGAVIVSGGAAGIPAAAIAWAKIVSAICTGIAVQAQTAVK